MDRLLHRQTFRFLLLFSFDIVAVLIFYFMLYFDFGQLDSLMESA